MIARRCRRVRARIAGERIGAPVPEQVPQIARVDGRLEPWRNDKLARREPQREERIPIGVDEADTIDDAIFRRIYINSRKRSTA